jgi:prevent-host-death family protein
MASISVLDAKTRFGELLERVAQGEEVVITKHDKPVARIIPEGRSSAKSIREAVASIRELRGRIEARTKGKSKLSLDDVKSARGEGRKSAVRGWWML